MQVRWDDSKRVGFCQNIVTHVFYLLVWNFENFLSNESLKFKINIVFTIFVFNFFITQHRRGNAMHHRDALEIPQNLAYKHRPSNRL